MSDIESELLALRAAAFAARAHHGQFRKDNQTPYITHPFRVATIVRGLFGCADADVYVVALLHDTIEDTTTDYDDIRQAFGPTVAGWVALLTKDKRLPDETREPAYFDGLASAPWQVKLVKLADTFDNLIDVQQLPRKNREKARRKAHEVLDKLKPEAEREPLPEAARILRTLLETTSNGSR